jgi:uncharacterized protein YaaR (DUF327 family)
MRIDFRSETLLQHQTTVKPEMGAKHFEEHLSSAQDVSLRKSLDEELLTINEQGKRLCDDMSIGQLKKYREMVAGFLKKCLEGGLCCKRETMSSQYGRTKVLTVVKKVDEKLLHLADAIISGNSDAMRVLSLVDEIRGLLFDLYA